MKKTAGPGIDIDHAWNESSGWAYGLVSPDPVVRSAALDRQARADREVEAAFDRMHQGRFLTRVLLFPARDRARGRAVDRCLPGALGSGSGYSYAFWLLDRPETPNTRHVWRTWRTWRTWLADARLR